MNFVPKCWKSWFQLFKKKRIKWFQEFLSWKYFADETSQSSLGKPFRTNHTIACITVSVWAAHLFQMGMIWSALQCMLLPSFKAAIHFLSKAVLISDPLVGTHSCWAGLGQVSERCGALGAEGPSVLAWALALPTAALGCSCRWGDTLWTPLHPSYPTAAVLTEEPK